MATKKTAKQVVDKLKKDGKAVYDFNEGDFSKRTVDQLADCIVRGAQAYIMTCIQAKMEPSHSGLMIYKSGFMTGIITAGYSPADWDEASDLADKKVSELATNLTDKKTKTKKST